ncbi:hypothetical protein [Hasllibacter sp. MH4015]|uniref:hypothetical protein n=1 Tax=Hasllibacter sp. MH4015 TaxID=2854029 RepID=UPI001CD39FB4|nr:hypothetical protein [Hasllibacter sp. MH4015]
MADNTTHIERREVEHSSGNGGFGFILGAVVVALAVVAYFVFVGMPDTAGPAATGGDSTSLSVTVEGGGEAAPAGEAAGDAGAAEGGAAAASDQ